jgi:hypothetical protein
VDKFLSQKLETVSQKLDISSGKLIFRGVGREYERRDEKEGEVLIYVHSFK